MKNIIFPVIFFAAFLLPVEKLKAEVVDAPHNQANGVSCSGCHSYSLWWQYSPLDSETPSHRIQIDALCSHCHYSGSPMTKGCGHSSTVMAEMHNPLLGDWQQNCLDCHDPHFQVQLNWLPQHENDLYLVTGQIGDAANFNYTSEETTFGYTILSQSPNWTDQATWSSKTGTSDNRGLILVVDTLSQQETYQLVTADASTITIKGLLDANDEGRSFGLVYGQFIKSFIQSPGNGVSTVQFFDPMGTETGYVNSQTPPTGICQVCHTNPNTRHWTADGMNTGHNAGIRCTNCHIPAQGFKQTGTFAGHNVTNDGGCYACHGPLNTLAEIEALHIVASNSPYSCEICHASTRPEVISAIATGSASCTDCHIEQTVHQAVYYYSDQIDMPLITTDSNGVQNWQAERLPFGAAQP